MYNNLFYAYSSASSIKTGSGKGIESEKNLFYSRGTIDSIRNLSGTLSFDPKPKKDIESNVTGIEEAVEYARMQDKRVYDSKNCTSSEEVEDILGNGYKPSLGCINRMEE